MKLNGRIEMRRNILLIVNYAVFLALFMRGISAINVESLEIIDFVNVIGAIVFIILIIKSLIEPYIVIDDEAIKINRDYFKKEILKINNVVDLEINESPFSSSFFLLNGDKKVKFNSFALGKEDKQLLLNRFSNKEKATS